jgi:hypothetical protein
MSGMKNKSLSVSATTIPYVPALRSYAGTVGSAVLMTQLDFFFGMKDQDGFCKFEDGFYKFLEPVTKKEDGNPANGHEKYRHGDSWCECLNITADEFRTMFDKIGMRYASSSAYRAARERGDPFQGKYYLSFVDRKANLTWYLRNHQKVDEDLDRIFSGYEAEKRSKASKPHVPHSSWQTPSTVDGKPHPQSCQTPSTELSNTCLQNTEITSEITSTTTNQVEVVDIEEIIESAVWQQRPQGFKKSEAAYRFGVRNRLKRQGLKPSTDDISTLNAWRKAMAPAKAATPPAKKAHLEIDPVAQKKAEKIYGIKRIKEKQHSQSP